MPTTATDVFRDFDHYRFPIGPDGTSIGEVRRLRDEAHRTGSWVGWCENYGGFWLVAGWDEARSVLRDPKTFTNRVPITPPFLNLTGRPLMFVGYDGEVHAQYRKIVQDWFTPQSAATMYDGFRQDASDIIDEFVEHGTADLAEEFGRRLPQRLVSRMIGVPVEETEGLLPLLYALSHAEGLGLDIEKARIELLERFMDVIRFRRQHAKESDVLSVLVHEARFDGRPLTDEDVLDYLMSLVDGAIENSAILLGDATWLLARDSTLRARLAGSPELVNGSLDEFLRYFSPAGGGSRQASADAVIGDVKISAGDVVFPFYPIVNRDPRQFADPDTFIVDRSPNRHLALSNGPHRCLGANVLRTEFAAGISELLRRIPEFELDPSRPARWALGGGSGMESVPVVFEPGQRASR
jgi:cytochrome P450